MRNINNSLYPIEEEVELSEMNNMADLDYITKALRLVPDFDGNPNVLTRFITLCDQLVAKYAESADLNLVALLNGILNKIVGPAARLINTNGIPKDWSGIRSALINNFSDQRDETALYNDLALLTQGSSTPQEFYERCQNLFGTVMTYVSLHDTLQTTVDSKRDLYRKLTLQAFLRGLKDPLGARIRCMRPESIEKALQFVHEEVNTMYVQNRNERLPDRNFATPQTLMNNGYTFKMPTQPLHMPVPRPTRLFNMPGPSRPQFIPQPQPQFRQNFNQYRPPGPTRTQQIFRATPPNYNPQHNSFQINQRFNQPRPMSGVSHFVTRPLQVTQLTTAHDWRKLGNPASTNYFNTREVNMNDCFSNYSYYDDSGYSDFLYYEDFDYPEYNNYDYDFQASQDFIHYPENIPTVTVTEMTGQSKANASDSDENFQTDHKSNKLK